MKRSHLQEPGSDAAATAVAPRPVLQRLRRATGRRCLGTLAALLLLAVAAGCAKYNTYYNARKAFDDAEFVRKEAIRKHEDPPKPTGAQKSNYEKAIQKAQKVLDEYPGHSLSDDALFLQAKAWHRLEGYRMSIRKLDLLFLNFPATEYMEEALYLQGLNYLLIGGLDRSQEFLDQLDRRFPESKYRAETLRVSGDNSFVLEQWEEAAEAYRAYLASDRRVAEADRVALKLAECYWELDRYHEAADVLKDLGQNSESADLGFRARLLRARVHARIAEHEMAATLLAELESEAEIYNARGEVRLAQAENVLAEGREDEAVTLLESMPEDWLTPTVKARKGEILAAIYVDRGDWEKARESIGEALRRRDDLEDPLEAQSLNETLRSFVAADQALVDAQGADAAALRLEKANALLFGLDRPSEAAPLYAAAAVDTAAADAVAARALYGALVTYRDHLDQPDSAAVYAALLEDRYPESPQAYEARSGGSGDLLGFLFTLREQEQADRYAALSDEEREILAGAATEQIMTGGAAVQTGGLRRRMIYLARRDNLVFAPTPDERDAYERRRSARAAADARTAAADSVRAAAAAAAGLDAGAGASPAEGWAVTPADSAAGVLPPGTQGEVGGRTEEAQEEQAEDKAADEDEQDEEEKDKKDKKDKKKEDVFDLRAPRPELEP